jgi:ESCRT-II complex subunit VPS25
LQVVENGLTNSIMTFYELTIGGELAHTTGLSFPPLSNRQRVVLTAQPKEFYELPSSLLRLSLATLVKQNKAQVFRGSLGEDGDGVKFF